MNTNLKKLMLLVTLNFLYSNYSYPVSKLGIPTQPPPIYVCEKIIQANTGEKYCFTHDVNGKEYVFLLKN
ncbi:hypothetical protein QE197_24160 (plasmid) [Arsenophonus nasoniae]|uniref:hypothetical protein n=1 Tax=Arsenophonus nasoniae TaxID=638 RepID=UPI00246846C2|nr:hypothetical protein [Arsenophonus nasoniae]WGM13609.1 hypothetical protein QE197_24160 [Arsenophonus nasoniae]WGM18348.1 hypothetical protein QE193_24400 [Arsenophonus nasoniae]